jgi:hypothetical protein
VLPGAAAAFNLVLTLGPEATYPDVLTPSAAVLSPQDQELNRGATGPAARPPPMSVSPRKGLWLGRDQRRAPLATVRLRLLSRECASLWRDALRWRRVEA